MTKWELLLFSQHVPEISLDVVFDYNASTKASLTHKQFIRFLLTNRHEVVRPLFCILTYLWRVKSILYKVLISV